MSAHLISTDLVPVGGSYVVLMALLAVGLRLRRRAAAHEAGQRPGWLARRLQPGWAAFTARVIGTVLGGYLLLMAVLTGYYYGVSRIGNHFLESAFTGCGMLAGLALPVFAVATILARRRRRPVTPADPPPPAQPAAD